MTASDSNELGITIERITCPAPEIINPVAETLTLAFDDEIMLALDGGRNMDLKRARMRAAVTTCAIDLQCYVGHLPGSKEVDCAMLVKPPGLAHGVSPNSAGPHTNPVKEMLKNRSDLIAASDQIKKIFHEVQTKAYGPNSVRDMYYISHVGTAPWAVGNGIGGKMLTWMVDKGKREGISVALLTFTERHKKFYERFGFTAKAELDADLNGTPTHWWAMSTA